MENDKQAHANIFPKSGRGLGHVTSSIFGSTVGYPSDSLAFCFSFMLIATGPPVGPIIAVNGLNDAFWWHSHSLYGLVKKK